MKYIKLFEEYINDLNESGSSIENAQPFRQDQIVDTLKWIRKTIFPLIGIIDYDIDAAVIGSAGKKPNNQTSGDIDIAVSAIKIASFLNTSLTSVLFELDKVLQQNKISTKIVPGFQQISIAAPIAGNIKNGIGQVDLMLTTNLNWSKFIYYSPDFRKAESQYKGAYRNLLLMSAIGKSFYNVIDVTDKDEIKEYEAYVVRLNQGIYKVRKSFTGKNGLLKVAKLLKEFDQEIAQEPHDVINLLFTGEIKPSDINTYEKLKEKLESSSFKFPEKLDSILDEFKDKLIKSKLPHPSDL